MPANLAVDIIRLDDATGETWGLPLQACDTWAVSFSQYPFFGPLC